jgi:hypothetical protein
MEFGVPTLADELGLPPPPPLDEAACREIAKLIRQATRNIWAGGHDYKSHLSIKQLILIQLRKIPEDRQDDAKQWLREIYKARKQIVASKHRRNAAAVLGHYDQIFEGLLAPIKKWKAGAGLSSLAHFEMYYGELPPEQRPYADEVRRANRHYYQALARAQSEKGESLHDLFPARPEGRRKPLTPEQALAEINRQREAARLRMQTLRAKRAQSKPDT